MTTAEDIEGFVRNLWNLLSPQVSEIILDLPQDALNPDQRAILAQYNQHFNNKTQASIHDDNPDENTTLVEDEAESSGAAENSKKGRGRPLGSDSWGAVMKLRDLQLDDGLVHHLKFNVQRDPSLFLHMQPFNPQPSERKSPMDALVTTCLSARRLSLDGTRNHNIWLLSTLVVGDAGVNMFGVGAIIRGKNSNDLRDAVVRRYNTMQDDEKRAFGISSTDELTQKVEEIIIMGDRLVWLCQQFSTGSLFFLSGTLTEFFILKRFTRAGKAWASAKKHLQNLQLQSKAQESGADALGDAIRAHLRDAYYGK